MLEKAQQPYKSPKVKCLSFWYRSATPKLSQLKVSYKGYDYNPQHRRAVYNCPYAKHFKLYHYKGNNVF